VIPAGFVQELLARVDVAEVVGRHVELKRAGVNLKGLCPFHGEKSPSFIVSPTRQTYHCFGCGVHGDAVRFLMEHTAMSFPDAVRELAQRAGMAVPEDDSDPAERARAEAARSQRATLSEVLEKAATHYRAQLRATPRAVEYLKGRGLTGEVAATFGLGYAPEGWRSLASAFARYDDPLLVDAGLVIVQGGEDGNEAEQRRYDRFRDRVMFPIRSVKGEVIGFGGRVLDGGEPKYLNSPETPVFSKGRELYGLHEARQALRERGYALVVEGYMDVVALAQSGFGNAVATLGTACTAEHVTKLFRFTDAVVFSFDGDAAGRRAAARALEAALPLATDLRSVRFLFLPAEHDPDSYVREHGADAFEAMVAQAVPLSEQLMVQAAADCELGTPEGRSRMLGQARPLFEALPEGLLREQVLSALAERGAMPREVLAGHWARTAARGARGNRGTPGTVGGSSANGSAGRLRVRSPGGGRTPPPVASLLDRSAWLLARHTPQWQRLSADEHEFLAGQPEPHGAFFAALERAVHDHGPLAMGALLQEISSAPGAQTLAALIERLRAFHDLPAEDDVAEQAAAALRRLRLLAVEEELTWLIESGELSEAAAARRSELFRLQRALRATPPSAH